MLLVREPELSKSEKRNRGTTLQHRLVLFFAGVTALLVLAFALLLLAFGINGRGEKAVRDYMTNELSHLSEAVGYNLGRLSLSGIRMSDDLADLCDKFFDRESVAAADLAERPELLEPLISELVPALESVMKNGSSSGAFILLDATVRPAAANGETARSGFYIRSMQPFAAQTVGAKHYCLRGPAQVARDNGIELLGQWRMEYDVTGEDFFELVMETARKNAGLPLSRLYYWTGLVTLHGNSESGFLLCVPLRSSDGAVFGVCGVEVSDRMFKQQYSPQESDYKDVFSIAAPAVSDGFQASQGMIAGNSFLTGSHMSEDLTRTGSESGFDRFEGGGYSYGGMADTVRLYPTDSPYAGEKLSVAVLMPEELLNSAIKGNSTYLLGIIIALLAVGLIISVVVSYRYLGPVKKALHSIQSRAYDGNTGTPYAEINDLFDFLAQKDTEHEREIRVLDEQRKGALTEAERERQRAERLADKKRREIDPESYALFLTKLKTLTPKEHQVFDLYLDGRSAKEIVLLMEFTENALKYHNKNIYGKLGVSSRKELLMYAALMRQEMATK